MSFFCTFFFFFSPRKQIDFYVLPMHGRENSDLSDRCIINIVEYSHSIGLEVLETNRRPAFRNLYSAVVWLYLPVKFSARPNDLTIIFILAYLSIFPTVSIRTRCFSFPLCCARFRVFVSESKTFARARFPIRAVQ